MIPGISSLITGGISTAVEKIGGTIRSFVTTDKDKMSAQIQVEKILQETGNQIEQTVRQEMESKERIITAELRQGDNYTKRARPTVVYYGLGAITVDLVARYIGHFTGNPIPETMLPTEFWVAWGGIVSTWVIGRSAEKRGQTNKVVDFITGK